MARWQTRLRFVFAALVVVVAVLVYRGIGERRTAPPPAAVPRLDPKAVVETRGAVVRQLKAAKEHFVVEAENQLTYEGGATKLLNAKITIRQRGGRDFVVTGRETQVSDRQDTIALVGDVRMATSDGFTLATDRATYTQPNALLEAPGAVTFSQGRMSGSGQGMTYDKDADRLELLDRASITFKAEGADPPVEISATRATLARGERLVLLEGAVKLVRGPQVAEADSATLHLQPTEDTLTDALLRGSSRLSGGAGSVDSMTAHEMDLYYAEDGTTLKDLALRGEAAMALVGSGGRAGRQIVGETIQATLASDGAVTGLVARDKVRLDLPAEPPQPARNIRAKTLEAGGEAGRGLTAATFTGEVEYREVAPGGAGRVARASALDVTLAPDGNGVTDAHFVGAARFQDGALRGRGADARYDPVLQTLQLSGSEGTVGPRVEDDRIAIDAAALDIALVSRRMKATGGVKSTLQPPRRTAKPAVPPARTAARPGPGPAATPDLHMPGLLKDGQAVMVTGAALDYDGTAGSASYTGGAWLWQGETAIQADSITLDQQAGDLTAIGSARSTLAVETKNETTGRVETTTTIARGSQMSYVDARRCATYTTGAQVNGPAGDLAGDKIELYLKDGGGIDRAEAYGSVVARLDTRVASGARLSYYAADERYVVSGGRVRVLEECRETTGKTLTFFKSADRILVDGNEQIRTQTTRGGKCVEPGSL